MKLKTLLFFFLFILGNGIFAQTINITDPDYLPVQCSSLSAAGANFQDNGGAGNYGANRNDTIVVCPDLPNGPKLSLTFGINAGLTYDVHATDTLYFFDGNSTGAPSLGTLNNGINPNGGTFASTFNNPSGCLTVVFHTDGANEGTGWEAKLTCASPPQPFEIHLEAFVNDGTVNRLNPIDTGYVDICFGDSVLLVAKPLFPNSLEATGSGYSQNMGNVEINWEFADGTLASNNDSVWFRPASRSGYYVSVSIEDAFPQTLYSFCKIRVSQKPDFYAAGPLENPICAYTTGTMIGGVTAADTAGVDIPEGAFILGGSVAGLTYLPDGSGQEYTTTITMDEFSDTAVFNQSSDLQYVCLTMEHTYLGDLEVWLTCPDGTEVALVNSYDPGHIPGGFDGGGTFLGDADDSEIIVPGIGWEYCFSTDNNTFSDMGTELGNGNTVPTTVTADRESMNPDGIYLPDTTFANFTGCPMNGDWTIHVRDNLGQDDGYIFEWSLEFNPELFPNYETYQNYVTDAHWVNEPTIVSGLNDTAIVVNPMFPGTYDYVFEVMDDFGCFYDTTAFITVKDTVRLAADDLLCGTSFDLTTNFGEEGIWTFFNSDGVPTFADSSDVNTTIFFPTNGTYNLIYTDVCNFDDTIVINNQTQPTFAFDSDFTVCQGDMEQLFVKDSAIYGQMHWNTFTPDLDTLYSATLAPGSYSISLMDSTGLCQADTSFTIQQIDSVILVADFKVCDPSFDFALNFGENGSWSNVNSPLIPGFADISDVNTTVTFNQYGTYNLVYSIPQCNFDDTITINYLAYPVFGFDANFIICPGGTESLAVADSAFYGRMEWNFFPDQAQDTLYSADLPLGTYTVTLLDSMSFCQADTTFTISNQAPVVLEADQSFCDDMSHAFTGNTVSSGAGDWTFASSFGIPQFSSTTIANPTVTFANVGVYTLAYTDSVCPNITDTVTLTIGVTPVFDLSSSFYDCPSVVEMTTLGNTTFIQDFSWDAGMAQFDNVYSAPLPMGTYNSSIETIFGCDNDTTFTIGGQQKIDIAPQTPLCGLALNMTNNVVTAPGTWSQISGNSAAVFGNPANINTTITVTQYGTYEFVYSESVCNDRDTLEFAFLPNPSVNIESAELCEGQGTPYQIIATATPGAVLTWSTGETGSSILVSEKGMYTVTANTGCGTDVDSALIDIRVCEVQFPNVFTPGADNLNPVYKVLIPTDGISEFNCQIFNRWGNLVHEYSNISGGWDGKAENGEDCSPGTYFYKLVGQTFLGGPVEMNGVFQLIRD